MPLFINFKNLIFKIVKKEEDFINTILSFSYIINKKAAIAISSFNYPVKTIADNFIIFKLFVVFVIPISFPL